MSKKETATAKDTSAKLVELHEKLRKIRFSMAGSRPKNVKEERDLKKDIARLLTEKNMGTK